MSVFGLWHGGQGSYAEPDPERDVERFEDMGAAETALLNRYFSGANYYQDFDFANRPAESVLTPAVNGLAYLDVYLHLDTDDKGDVVVHTNGPDFRMRIVDGPDVHIERLS